MEDARYETEAIVSTGMSDYFLLNHEIVRRTIEKDDVITKTGRGSAPSYYTNTLLGLSSIDRFALPMEMFLDRCKNRHPSPICTRFEHHFHVLKPHLHRRSFSDTLPENQRHLIALKRHPLWHMQKLCQLSQPAELRSFLQEQECRSLSRCSPTVESARAVVGVLSQLRKSIPSTHAPSRCSKPVPVLKPYIFPHRKDMGGHTSWPPPSRAAFKPLRSRIETRPSTRTS